MASQQADPSGDTRVVRLIGVYNASGTPWGEFSYWLKARVGGSHCALCDITHGAVREKGEWKQCRTRFAVPFTTVHLNDRDNQLRDFTEGHTPCVVAETAGGLVMLVDDAELRSCDRSPECLVTAISTNVANLGLDLG